MKRFFLRGLGALLPLLLTILVFYLVFDFLHTHVGVPIGEAIRWGVGKISTDVQTGLEEQGNWVFPVLGFIVAFILTLVIGFLVATFLGKKLIKLMDWFFQKMPIIRIIYPHAKQLSEFLFSDEEHKKMEFKAPVAVPFPAKPMFSIAFVTSEGLKHLNDVTGKHYVCVFVPTSPTPFTGFIVYVAREDIIPLPISVDEAMRLFISAGVLAPPHQMVHISDLTAGTHRPLPDTAEEPSGGESKT